MLHKPDNEAVTISRGKLFPDLASLFSSLYKEYGAQYVTVTTFYKVSMYASPVDSLSNLERARQPRYGFAYHSTSNNPLLQSFSSVTPASLRA